MLGLKSMTKIVVEPGGLEFEAKAGETVMGAANARGAFDASFD